jgi:hypothetical protein
VRRDHVALVFGDGLSAHDLNAAKLPEQLR